MRSNCRVLKWLATPTERAQSFLQASSSTYGAFVALHLAGRAARAQHVLLDADAMRVPRVGDRAVVLSDRAARRSRRRRTARAPRAARLGFRPSSSTRPPI